MLNQLQLSVYSFRLDQIAFAVVGLALLVLVDQCLIKTHSRIRQRWFTLIVVTALMVIAQIGTIVVEYGERSHFQTILKSFASTFAAEMETLGHHQVETTTHTDDSRYASMIRRQQRWLQRNPAIHDIYSLRLIDGRVPITIVDSETGFDRNGTCRGDSEMRPMIGAIRATSPAASQTWRTGQPTVTSQPLWGPSGLRVSAFAPIFHPQGGVEGLLGIDYDAGEFVRKILWSRLTALILGYALCGALLIANCIQIIQSNAELRRQMVETIECYAAQLEDRNQQLAAACAAAHQANQVKGEFLANMSHEIRTPLNGIIGLTELMLHGELDREHRKQLELVYTSAEALLDVLNDVLDYSKIEAKRLTLSPHPFGIREMMEDTIRLFAPQAHHKNLELSLRVMPNVPTAIVGDEARIRQVLVNLLGNAVKFTESGEIAVAVSVIDQSDQEIKLQFSVRDTGIGIPTDKQQLIFEPFHQADSTTSRKYGGSGLGLTICNSLVSLMGGKMSVISQPGQGATFLFTLACQGVDAAQAAEVDISQVTLENVRVLVVDDNATNRLILDEMLQSWRVSSKVLPGGEEVVEEFLRADQSGQPYHVILMDAHMPGMSGFELTRRIRQHSTGQQAKIVMLSSCDLVLQRDERLNENLDAFLCKPIKRSELLETFVQVLEQGERREFAKSQNTAGSTDIRPVSLRPLRVLVAEDNYVNQQLMVRGLQRAGHEVLLANDGAQAVDLLRREAVDVVLMDVQMPVMDGLAATQAIRQAAIAARQGGPLPIIALTANALSGDRARCLAAGMDDYAAKPIIFGHLFATIARHVPTACLDTAASCPLASSAGSAFVDRQTLLERIDGDLDFLAHLFEAFHEESREQLEQLSAAFSARDFSQAKKLAHTLKGTSSNLGGSQVSELARQLEHAARDTNTDHVGEMLNELRVSLAAMHRELQEIIATSPVEIGG